VDTRDLEAAFAKIGRVSSTLSVVVLVFTFGVFGIQVKKASVMYDPHTRESRGFGFVTMETAEEADAAITALNSTELVGKIVTVERVCFVSSV
jgi:RNA recognition motif-containing protein